MVRIIIIESGFLPISNPIPPTSISSDGLVWDLHKRYRFSVLPEQVGSVSLFTSNDHRKLVSAPHV